MLTALGWLGGAYATLILAISATPDAYGFIRRYDLLIVLPLGLTAFVSGVALAGWARLLTHYWVLAKLVLIITALAGSLLLRAPLVDAAAAGDERAVSRVVTGSAIVLVALIVMALLGMYRPGGRIRPHRPAQLVGEA
jgi:hypothetical protein